MRGFGELGRSWQAALAIAATAAVALPAAASAAWSPPVFISAVSSDFDTMDPRVAVDDQGDAVLVWRRFDGVEYRIQARSRAADGTLGPVRNLSTPGADALQPRLGVDADGDAVFAWTRSEGSSPRVQMRTMSAAGELSPIETLSSKDGFAQFPDVAVEADGDAAIAWSDEGTVYARRLTKDGSLGSLRTIDRAGTDRFSDTPDIALDGDGDALVAWNRASATTLRVMARTMARGEPLGPIEAIAPSLAGAQRVELTPDGRAVFAWQRFNAPVDRVDTRARTVAGNLSPIQTVSRPGAKADDLGFDLADDGAAVYTWTDFDSSQQARVRVRGRSPAGALTPVRTASASGISALETDVDLDAAGDGQIAWSRFARDGRRVEARGWRAAGNLALPLDDPLSEWRSEQDEALGAAVDVSEHGDAAVVWFQGEGSSFRVEASFGP